MDKCIMETGKKVNLVDLVFINGKIMGNIKDFGNKVKSMEKVRIFIQINQFLLEIIKKENRMDMEKYYCQINLIFKEIFLKVIRTVMVWINEKWIINIIFFEGNLLKIKKMDLAICNEMEINILVNFLIIK